MTETRRLRIYARRPVRLFSVAFAAAWLAGAACARESDAPSATAATGTASTASGNDRAVAPPSQPTGLRRVPLPDVSTMGASVQRQMQAHVDALERLVARADAGAAELGAEYGRLGVLLMAAEQLDAAEPAFANAQQLQPEDARWPYYLGQLYRLRGPVGNAVSSFERVLALSPDDVAAMVWLGEMHLTEGRLDAASALFTKVMAKEPQLVPALFGAGRVALERKDYGLAVKLLEQCLVLDPRGTAAHYPLGLAYRGLGNTAMAQAHIDQRGEVRIDPVDPLMAALDVALESPRAYDIRGGRALETGDFAGAAENFRKGLELTPADPALRLRLGTALFQLGDAPGAQEQFERVLRDSPTYARAHYSLAILAEAGGRRAEAIKRLTSAVEHGPDDASARLMLASLLRQEGQLALALGHYDHARKLEPRRSEHTLGYVLTLTHLERHTEARDVLVEALKAYPDELEYVHALARLMAASPDASVRDGQRALALVQRLMKGNATAQVGETLAMALAELGRFDQAVQVQREVMFATEKAGATDIGGAMAANLKRYESRQPARSPWPRN